MLYEHQVCQGCCTYIRCVRDVVRTSGVSGMLHVHQVCQGCCMYIRCVRDVVRTSGVSGMLYVHQVCQGCCTYIRCVRDVVRTSGVSGMLHVHQVCQGCCTYIRCVRDVVRTLCTPHTPCTPAQHLHIRPYTLSHSALWIPLLITVTVFMYMWYVHPVGQGMYLKATIVMVKVCVLCRHDNMLQQIPNKYIMYTCAI